MPSPATLIRLKLLACGYSPLPLMGKIPVGKGWQQKLIVNAGEIELWERIWPTATNTGILTQRNCVLDSDLTCPDAAYAARDHVTDRYAERGVLPVRIGKSPKWAVVFRCDAPFSKM